MKNKLRTRKNNKDILMLSISIFAIIGGSIVFRSFAAKNTDTIKPGKVTISKLVEDGNNTISFEVKNNLMYCLDSRIDIKIDKILVKLNYDISLNKYCFIPEKDSIASIDKNNVSNSELTIIEMK